MDKTESEIDEAEALHYGWKLPSSDDDDDKDEKEMDEWKDDDSV